MDGNVAYSKQTTETAFPKAKTISDQLVAIGNHANGFHLMRIALAVAIVVYHTIVTSDGRFWDNVYWRGEYRGLIATLLPMFFALSGFLVAGSFERTPKLTSFLGLRVIRIVPALAVEILLCALILGPIVTNRPLLSYFTDPEFFAYFRNIIGDIHYTLPGVFQDNKLPNTVNASLWTVPLELQSYGLLSVLAILGFMKRRYVMLAILGAICLIEPIRRIIMNVPEVFGTPEAWLLMVCFFVGMLVFRFREKLVFNPWLGAMALLTSVLCFTFYHTTYWGVPLVAYGTITLGLINIPRIPIISNGDYSYGLYLFAFPIQQLFAHLFPDATKWYWNAGFTLLLGMAYAAFSWHCVENPVLKRKKIILRWIDSMTAWVAKRIVKPLLAPLRAKPQQKQKRPTARLAPKPRGPAGNKLEQADARVI